MSMWMAYELIIIVIRVIIYFIPFVRTTPKECDGYERNQGHESVRHRRI